MNKNVDESSCPFCEGQNQCGVNSEAPCWCVTKVVPKELIALLPEEQRGQACICSRCIDAYLENPKEFQRQYSDR